MICGGRYRKLLLVLVAALWSVPVSAVADEKFGGQETMNGYALSQFGDFIKEWPLVTVRFREDTREMRLTYANDLAWKALLKGVDDYPDGAVFAKVGITTEDDPSFISSKVPSGAKRFQLMVRDRKKHLDTAGWGYALFDQSGRTFDEDPAVKTMACHACHAIVPERGYVFSQPMVLDVGRASAMTAIVAGAIPSQRVAFDVLDARNLPAKLAAWLPAGAEKIRTVTGPLRDNLFQGTLDEIRPTLMEEAKASGLPAALISRDGKRFSMVYVRKSESCDLEDGTRGIAFSGAYSTKPADDQSYPVSEFTHCARP
jgi:hypothetical protein